MYIEKMKLKNASIKGNMNKIEQQLKQKEEMGDVLHYIDFHQLQVGRMFVWFVVICLLIIVCLMQIENKQYIDKIEQRSAELLQLKMTTGKTVQVHPRENCLNVGRYVKTDHACSSVHLFSGSQRQKEGIVRINREDKFTQTRNSRTQRSAAEGLICCSASLVLIQMQLIMMCPFVLHRPDQGRKPESD